ncbi:sensor histidine kinase [Microbacterium sp. YY-01]|uniref:sensor histidine kinase n=1 Tax=Microbacterium sp. YY-01 TaxID=3421634 RepID=UPI003D1803DE
MSTSDAVTRWWRRISLRAKVTGVTVAVLALGLIATGVATAPILRSSLVANVDAQLPALASSATAERFFDILPAPDGGIVVKPVETSPRFADYIIAIYETDGTLQAIAGRRAPEERPVFPERFTIDRAIVTTESGAVFSLFSPSGEEFRATAAVHQSTSSYAFYVQIVALPLDETDRIIATYFGVYVTVALITVIVAALLTRVLVTLTFRRLGHVESTAMAIAGGDYRQRLTDLEPTTEVGRLNSAINTMLDRVDASIAQRDHAVQQMRRFIGDASHELRTPLVSVRGYAELYRMGAIRGEEDTARAMERIEKEALRMGVLVEDLLNLARLDEARELEIVPLDLRPLAHDAALDVRAAAPQRTVTVIDTTLTDTTKAAPRHPDASEPADSQQPSPATTTAAHRVLGARARNILRRRGRHDTAPVPKIDISASEIDFSAPEVQTVRTPPIVLGEENKVRQLLTNLLGNARRFSAEDSPIEIVVGSDRAQRRGWISIVDHGEGIPEQIREQIFQRFWRADTSRARETGGSGLGLAIVASIVKALSGSVEVTETEGGGATFTVSFPLAPVPPQP